ncbi:MAG TPA: SWIM zinc finger family protein [Pyrinomonadaceae bacterium]|nr:SWIM zinc finger family protein [Pyrinomonadaceae bacterium]
MSFSPEQIIALAPDAPSAKAGRSLASTGKWPARGYDERAVWGECRGSGKEPYRTQIDLTEPAFRCTCPSRKFPCKHALGLFLLFATQQSSFASGGPPPWVVEWLEKRDRQQPKRGTAGEADQAPAEAAPPTQKKRTTKVKRSSERQTRVAAGLAELELWMRDLTRRGLAAAQTQPPKYWEQMAARLIDAQAPGAARRVREMSSVAASAEEWADVMLARMGSLFLAAEGFKRIESLPEPVQADLRAYIGWTTKEEELSADGLVRDRWVVTGQRTYEEDKLRVQRTWLRGEESGRDAALLDFAAPGQALTSGLLTGTMIDAELVYYPSNYPLRASLRQRHSAPVPRTPVCGYASAESFLSAYADALARNPWIEVFPALFDEVVPIRRDEVWLARDAGGRLLPLGPQADGGWKLLAFGGGRPVTLFGEWDGRRLLPLGVWAEGRYARV